MIFTFEDAQNQHKHSPRLARALRFGLSKSHSVIDFGCGQGYYISELSKHRFKVIGIEGTPDIEKISFYNPIIQADISEPFHIDLKGAVLCLEVIEHIPKEKEHQVLENINTHCNGKLIISWAVKGQGGHGHVNEEDAAYVIPTIEKMGYKYNRIQTDQLRMEGGKDLWWFKKSIYVFDKITK